MNNFIQEIAKGLFYEAQSNIDILTEEEIDNALYLFASDERSFCSYAFVCFLLSTKEVLFWHQLGVLLVGYACPLLAGSYEIAAYHARRIFELSLPNNPEQGEELLFLFDSPARAISQEEALYVARTILAKNSLNQKALEIIKQGRSFVEDILPEPRDMREQLTHFIVKGKLAQAKEMIVLFSNRALLDIILYLGCEERNIAAYAFIWYLLQEKEIAELHYIAYRIIVFGFSLELNGCDAVALFHIKRAMHLDPSNEKYREHFIMLHTPPLGPNKLISNDEVEAVIKVGGKNHHFYSFSRMVLKKIGKDI